MNLLIFNYALAAFLFLFSYYLDSHSEKENNIFTTVGMASSFTALFAAIAIHLAYTGNSTLALLMLRLMLLCFSFTVFPCCGSRFPYRMIQTASFSKRLTGSSCSFADILCLPVLPPL